MLETIKYMVNQFNLECANLGEKEARKKCEKVMNVRDRMVGMKDNQGVIVSRCRRSSPSLEGDFWEQTITESGWNCGCTGFSYSRKDALGFRKPCSHLVFTATATAVHHFKTGFLNVQYLEREVA